MPALPPGVASGVGFCPQCGQQMQPTAFTKTVPLPPPGATTCPTCGRPLGEPITIQKTSKRIKTAQLLGAVAALVGAILLAFAFVAESVVLQVLCAMMAFGGLGTWAVANFAQWWHHG